MKKFLINILFFAAPVILLSWLFDGILTKGIRKSQTGDVKVWDEIFGGKINSDVVIYGSSRAQFHIDPSILEDTLGLSTYNLGIRGHSYLMAKYRHDILLKHNKTPKIIICSVDFISFEKRVDLYGYKNFAPFLDDSILRKATKQYTGFDCYDYDLPLVRYIGYKKEILGSLKYLIYKKQNETDEFSKGYCPYQENWNGEFDKVKATLKKIKANIDSNTLVVFENFLEEAHNKKIKIIFVYCPEYYESKDFIENRTDLVNIFKKYADKYAIPVLDYSNDTLCNDKKYFYDAEHLNVRGATIFSSHLAHDIKTLTNS